MFQNILLDILKRWLGSPQAPASALTHPGEHARRRGLSLPLVAHSCTPRRKGSAFRTH